ncbi:OLC1v1004730C1 [Oldenlandia corymbosa var. corymbosa]|uniref:OLC1v1004730C1 n=1 Tax=Oldenlandia corymbosa var. corymbosa TaxID=529605 RepID=A0AAV1DD18_OLDCO|nr:OLC1v1004730C1 [Oldenlandia corymbosa var. corymbosa]
MAFFSSPIIARIDSALDDLELLVKARGHDPDEGFEVKKLRMMLRILKMFVLCSRKLGKDGKLASFLLKRSSSLLAHQVLEIISTSTQTLVDFWSFSSRRYYVPVLEEAMGSLEEKMMFLENTMRVAKMWKRMQFDISTLVQKINPVDQQTHIEEVEVGLDDLLITLKSFIADHGEKDPHVPVFNFPRTNQLGFVEFILEKLMQLTSSEAELTVKICLQTIQEELVFLRSVLGDIVELRSMHKELQALWDGVLEEAYRIECLMDNLLVGHLPNSFSIPFDSIMKDIGNIKDNVMKTSHERFQGIKDKEVSRAYTQVSSQRTLSLSKEVVGLVDEAKFIMDRLMRGQKKLRIVAIVGMPGVGKTTLATKVYNAPAISHRFPVRAWCSISQVLEKKKVLIELLNQIDPKMTYYEIDEHDLADKLRRRLKRRRYLILVILTSRHHDVPPRYMLDQEPLILSQLSKEASLELLERKLFAGTGWPFELSDLKNQIVEICKGSPLAIVIVAGLLASTKAEDWMKILDSLNSSLASITKHCMKTLELKTERGTLFSFPEGSDELLAFDEPHNSRRLCINSVTRDFKESKLFCPRARSLLFNSSHDTVRLHKGTQLVDVSFVIHIFKLLRVLDLEQIRSRNEFPREIELILQLAFLAIRGKFRQIPSSIAKLSNLETLIIDPCADIVSFLANLWSLQKLKYLYIRTYGSFDGGSLPTECLHSTSALHELTRLSGAIIPHWSSMERLMRKFPNIRNWKCPLFEHKDDLENLDRIVFPDFLSQLESLHVLREIRVPSSWKFELSLPATLKKLTLSEFYLSWKNFSATAKLPNLDVLKLLQVSFETETWEVNEGEFLKLRILTLFCWDLVS